MWISIKSFQLTWDSLELIIDKDNKMEMIGNGRYKENRAI